MHHQIQIHFQTLIDLNSHILTELAQKIPSVSSIEEKILQRGKIIDELDTLFNETNLDKLPVNTKEKISLTLASYIDMNNLIQPRLALLKDQIQERIHQSIKQQKIESRYDNLVKPDISYLG